MRKLFGRTIKYLIQTKKFGFFNSFFFRLPYTRLHNIRRLLFDFEEVVEWKGIRARINPRDNHEYYLYLFGEYWEPEVDKLIELSSDKKVFADVGCNIGLFSLAVAKSNNNLTVFSFDPSIHVNERFKNNLELNPDLVERVNFIQKAASSENGFSLFSSTKVDSAVGRINKDTRIDAYSVETISLDEYFNSISVLPDIVKIDVEGAELKVIKGMKEMLSRGIPDYILVETHGFYFKDKISEFNAELIYELITNHYKIYLLKGDEVSPFKEENKNLDRMHLLAEYKTA